MGAHCGPFGDESWRMYDDKKEKNRRTAALRIVITNLEKALDQAVAPLWDLEPGHPSKETFIDLVKRMDSWTVPEVPLPPQHKREDRYKETLFASALRLNIDKEAGEFEEALERIRGYVNDLQEIQPTRTSQHVEVSTGSTDQRRKRSTVPKKELGAQLHLIDTDASSDFVITKIEFKEFYGDQEETHVVDFEKEELLQDPSASGCKLAAEFTSESGYGDKDEVEVVTYNIVLTPRGG